MQIKARPTKKLPKSTNLVLFSYHKAKHPIGSKGLGAQLEKIFREAGKSGYEGAAGQIYQTPTSGSKFGRIIFLGLGKENEANLQSLREATGRLNSISNQLKLSSFILKTPLLGGTVQVGQAIAEGIILGSYTYTAYKSKAKPQSILKSVGILANSSDEIKGLNRGIRLGEVFGKATLTARDLVNNPPSDLAPENFVGYAKKNVKSPVQMKIFSKKQIEKMKMGSFLGVNRGSAKPPYFIHFIYKPKGKINRRIGICGKGITFDSGGLSLKPPRAMETMKMDMAGAATVLSLFRALSQIKPSSVEVHGFTPLTDNLPGEKAVKPGDVLRAMNGKTIEVLNTDAEGRLVLADALCYAERQKLDELMDIATLTGACTVALGNSITGFMGTHPAFNNRLKEASEAAGEKIWELPLEKDYENHIKSNVADIKNMGLPMQAGTIIGGMFLKEFVKPSMPWIHIDIASTAWSDGNTSLTKIGATGSMVRTLLHHIMSYN